MIHRQWFEPRPNHRDADHPGNRTRTGNPTGAGTGTGTELAGGVGATDPIVLLHEGLGSVSAWGPFPAALAAATGRRVLAYDRRGYGRSEPHPGPWPARYLHDEAARLPLLLAEEGVGDGLVLVGHSDGASIALLYPSQAPPGSPRPAGIVSLSAHVLVEEVGVVGIAETTRTYHELLRHRLARHHDDADATFAAWSEVWLSDRFRPWTLDDDLRSVTCPVLALQGTDDRYGTDLQLVRIAAAVSAPVECHELAGADHWPHRGAADAVLRLTAQFCGRLHH
jgi:pimeloyl-ACP methyl ester carboxylesterase